MKFWKDEGSKNLFTVLINRFKRIKSEFGTSALLRTLLLLFGLAGMSVIGIAMLGRFDALIISVVGLAVGVLLRNIIPNWAESLPTALRIGLFVYGLVLFLGDRIGLDNSTKLAIIAATTVIVFNLNFWALSDREVFNTNKDSR